MNLVKKIFVLLLVLTCLQTAKADWTKQTSNTLAWLRDVYFLNEQTGWIVGSGGTILTTVDGGKTWIKKKNFTQDVIRQVFFTDERNGWLLCERNLYALGSNSPSYFLKTNDGGINWKRAEFTDNQRKRVTKFLFTKKGAVLAVGEGGAFFAVSSDERSWKRMQSPVRYLLFDGIFTDDSHGVIVGAGGSILFTEDAGATWIKAVIFGNPNTKLNSVFFVNQRNGWTVGTQGRIYQTFNGGKIWREQKSNLTKDLTDVFFNNTAEGWAVGDEGAILHTTTAGNVWEVIDSKNKHRLEKIFFIGKKGWAVGFGGTILFYDDNNAGNKSALIPAKLKLKN